MANKKFSDLSKGAYNNSTAYTVGDFVNYNGSSYACRLNTTGNLPTNTTYWALLASKGDTGAKGDKGDTGDTGNGIASIVKTGTVGLTDTYTITFTDSTTTTYDVVNGEDGTDGVDGDDAYVYIAYASDDTGTDFTTTFNPLLDYIAIKNTTTAIPSPSASDFTGLWKNYKGEKGDTGDIGVDWQGSWSAGSYTANQAVSHNGSSWIATTTTTEEPSISATDWDLIALKGTDGAGSGDVIGPATNTANYIPQWDGANSKTLKDGLGLDTDLSSVSANDDTVPSAKATKAMGDLKLAIASKATQAEVATGTDNDKYVTPLAVQPYSNNSLYRQAIINGNFDVWQRGTSFNNPNVIYTSDRWKVANAIDVNIKVLRSTDVPNVDSLYSLRAEVMTATGGVGAISDITQPIENYSFFAGKQVTLSVWVKCDSGVTGSLFMRDSVGDSSTVAINNTSWTKYTITTNINTGITSLTPALRFNRSGITVGNGMYIAQVQLNAGSVALPFQPKSFADELRDCQRYYQTRVVRTINGIMNYGLPVDMRTTPSIATASAGTIANATATGYQITHNANADSTVVLSAEL